MVELLGNLPGREHVGQTHPRSAIEQRERHPRFRVILPDELQHQELVEIRIQQGSDDWIQLPVVVVRPLREVHDHRLTGLIGRPTHSTCLLRFPFDCGAKKFGFQ